MESKPRVFGLELSAQKDMLWLCKFDHISEFLEFSQLKGFIFFKSWLIEHHFFKHGDVFSNVQKWIFTAVICRNLRDLRLKGTLAPEIGSLVHAKYM